MKNPFSLEGKTILVTGASSGIGQAIACQCAEFGARCIISARNVTRLKGTLSSMNGDAHCLFQADLTNNDEISGLVNELPKLDGLVCCAGIADTTLLKFTGEDELLKMFETNTFSTIRLIREIVKQKKLEREASVVMISSVSGVRCGYVGGSLYGSTKGAIEGFAKSLALELAPQKIRVNTVTPGMVETGLLESCDIDQATIDADILKFPLKRYGKPEEIAYSAVYLLSDATKWMTGTSLLIDGGYTIM